MDEREGMLLARLAGLCGVLDGYHDLWGTYHAASPATQRAVLEAMGVAAGTPEELEREIRLREAGEADVPCGPVVILPEEGEQTLRLAGAADDVAIRLEGRPLEAAVPLEGGAGVRLHPPLPLGLHAVEVEAASGPDVLTRRTLLAVCPARGYEPDALAAGGRVWGVNLPLYALRSGRNAGVGDFADLRAAVGWAANLGADFLGLLPLHALFNESPYGLSPYYPSSRLFLNPLYIAVDEVPEASTPAVRRHLEAPETLRRLEALRAAELVDYPGAWAFKRGALHLCHEAFLAGGSPGRLAAFDAWRRQQGEALEGFAAFGALRDHLAGAEGEARPWREWPEAWRAADGPAVRQFRQAHGRAVSFHAWLQWVAADQLQEVIELARRRTALGLYLDLALGVDPCGADGWLWKDVLALGASAGCPPDPFSLLGQKWGLPPVIPERHRQAGCALFLETLRRSARLAGALRIDHALALWRLFWIPEGLPASEGAYVDQRPEELVPLLRLVSREERCLIVGEDLGTIPPEVREGLMDSGFLSYRLGIFEKEWDGRYRSPREYPRRALVSIATHDLPTLDGFWLGRDLEVKRALGRYPDDQAARGEAEGRRWDRLRLQEALRAEGLLPDGLEPAHEAAEHHLDALAEAAHAFLARTPSALFLANLDDLLGSRDMQNLPGTLDEHPNWRRKVAVPLEEWPTHGRANRIAAAIRREGRGTRPDPTPP